MALDACPMCGQPVTQAGARFCDHCGASLFTAAESGGSEPQDAGPPAVDEPAQPRNSIPFEDRSLPFWERLTKTIGRAFSDPLTLFSAMPREDIGPPLIYGVLVGTVATVFSLLWNMAFGSLFLFADDFNADEFVLSTGLNVAIMIFSPLLVAIGLFISAGIYHVVLLMLGDGQRGFAVTFRATVYGSTPQLLNVVPLCGGIVGGLWSIVLVIVAASQGHRTEWWRALLAYVLPGVVCCCLLVWIFVSFGFLAAVSQK